MLVVGDWRCIVIISYVNYNSPLYTKCIVYIHKVGHLKIEQETVKRQGFGHSQAQMNKHERQTTGSSIKLNTNSFFKGNLLFEYRFSLFLSLARSFHSLFWHFICSYVCNLYCMYNCSQFYFRVVQYVLIFFPIGFLQLFTFRFRQSSSVLKALALPLLRPIQFRY